MINTNEYEESEKSPYAEYVDLSEVEEKVGRDQPYVSRTFDHNWLLDY